MLAMLKPSDVAAQFNCSPGHVRRLCRTGQLRAMRLGSDWRISPEAVADFKARNTNAAPAATEPTPSEHALAVWQRLVARADGERVLGERWWESRPSLASCRPRTDLGHKEATTSSQLIAAETPKGKA